jgi:DNA (cytosine-5)-methyltransferase 1
MITVGSDFSGVGAFNQALKRLGIEYNEIFACDMDKYARQTFIHNYGEPKYYPTNVYEREIPLESLDIYMTSPPCQAFSLAGKRLGKEDKRGILFFNSLEFIQQNQPRFFIFENVKGLLSDDNGRTFSEWVNFLGGKSVNGAPVLFPYADAVEYHLYWKVLNAKHYGVPQNRERVFLIGIRDDKDNNFSFPAEDHLTKRLKDVLESEVNEKYFLSENNIKNLQIYNDRQIENNRGFSAKFRDVEETETMDALKVGGGGKDDLIKVIAFGRSEDEKKRRKEHFKKTGLDSGSFKDKELIIKDQDYFDTLLANPYLQKEGLIFCGAIRGRGEMNEQTLELNNSDYTNSITTVQKDNILTDGYKIRRLTPRECFRLMDFPDSFTWPVSDSQAYKQAGNSIVVNVLYKILKNLNI